MILISQFYTGRNSFVLCLQLHVGLLNQRRCNVIFVFTSTDVVAVSSIDYGLFLLQLAMAAIEAPSDVTLGEQHRYRQTVYGQDYTTCPQLVERRTCVPEPCY